ncbi:MAG TPA: hypothetical protein VFN22_12990 [Gemmatimonadales bacterium]|nr:hypothetical protein [Gemmatimonadales bacterium]
MPTSRLAIAALWLMLVALVTMVAALVKSRGDWRAPAVLIPVAIILGAVHFLVPMSEGVQIILLVLATIIIAPLLVRFVRNWASGSRDTAPFA